MNTLIITKGLPASGKSTWAKEQIKCFPNKYKRVNRDDLRDMMDNGIYSEKNEKFLLKIRNLAILTALKDKYDVIIDDTNLQPKQEQDLRFLVLNIANVVVKDFRDVSLFECIKRDEKRIKKVGKEIICDMYYKWINI